MSGIQRRGSKFVSFVAVWTLFGAADSTARPLAERGSAVFDFGDAPEPAYPTLLASDGARHLVLPVGNPTLGPTADVEPDGQPSASLSGDDESGTIDDENGVSFPAIFIPGTTGTMIVSAGPVGGNVSTWIDWYRFGSWNLSEDRVATDIPVAAGTARAITFPVPPGASAGSIPVRVRISSGTGLLYLGPAPDGEVEDHFATVAEMDIGIGLAQRLTQVTHVDGNRFDLRFDLRLDNRGNVPLKVQIQTLLALAFTAAQSYSVVSVSSSDFAVNPFFEGNVHGLLAPNSSLDGGRIGRVTLIARVDTGGVTGPYSLYSIASGRTPTNSFIADDSQDGEDPDPDGDGNPSNNDEPTVFELVGSAVAIPALDGLGLGLLALLVASAALGALRRPARERTLR